MDEVKEWLCENGFEEYCQNFEDNGWDDLTLLPNMTTVQIKKCIHKEGHVVKFRKAVRQLKNDNNEETDNGTVMHKRKPDALVRKRTTKSAKERKQPAVSSSGSSLGSSLSSSVGQSLTKFARVKDALDKDEEPQDVGQIDTVTDESTHDGSNSDADINTPNADIFSPTHLDQFSTDEVSTSSEEDCSMPVARKTYSDPHTSKIAEEPAFPANMPMNFTYIAHSDQTTVNKAPAQIVPEIGLPTSAVENHKDQMESVANWYEKPDKLYVETHAFRECKHILNDKHWVTILGKPGDGKSMMAAHLMSQYRNEGFEPVFITSVQDWKSLISCDKVKQFVVIDDMFGNTCLDRMKLNEWVSYLGIMEKIVAEGNLIVACTSRKYIFEDVKSSLAKIGSFKKFMLLDLTSQSWKLTIKEKEEIFEQYAAEYRIEDYNKQDIGRTDPPHGYPHCVAMFCTNIFFRNVGLPFFENPAECVQSELLNFRNNDRIKYLVLLLGLLNKTKLKRHTIETLCYEPTEATKKLFKAVGVSLDTSLPDICSALDSLTSTYLEKDADDCYHFTHESLLENVAAVFISMNPVLAIEMVDFRLLLMKTNTGKSVLSFSNLEAKPYASVNEGILQPVIRRITTELLHGNVFFVILCDVWCDQNFVDEWVKYVSTTMDVNILNELFCSGIHACSNVFTTLIQLNREYVVKTILGNATLCEKLALTGLLQQGLEMACARKCSVELIKTFVSHPNATSKRLKGSELLMNALDNSNLACANVLIQTTEIDLQYVDKYGRGYFHRLVRVRVKRDEIESFETLLKTLLDLGIGINSKDFLGESPLDFCTNNIDNVETQGEQGSAYLICACLVRNGMITKHVSAFLRSCIFEKLRSGSTTDILTAKKMFLLISQIY